MMIRCVCGGGWIMFTMKGETVNRRVKGENWEEKKESEEWE